MPSTKKQARKFKSVSINLEEGEVPRVLERVRKQDITVSQYFRRLVKEDLKRCEQEVAA
jgi:hypothetical protein